MTAQHIYIDETKERGCVLVATTHVAADTAALRKTLRRELVLPGQTRIHMAKESSPRRRKISDVMGRHAPRSAAVYDAARRYPDPLVARQNCLQAVIDDIPAGMETLLVLDQDDSILHWDKEFLYNAIRLAGLTDTVRYRHQRARAELLLTVPDAVAWCWARGAPWRNRILPAIRMIKQV
jgi:hypothetical protein